MTTEQFLAGLNVIATVLREHEDLLGRMGLVSAEIQNAREIHVRSDVFIKHFKEFESEPFSSSSGEYSVMHYVMIDNVKVLCIK